MEYHFIINPTAGKTDMSNHLQELVRAQAEKAKVPADCCAFHITEYAGHATKLAEALAKTGKEMVLFAVGGDGTLNEVFRGAWEYQNAVVGCVPYGSGNDFLRNFGTREAFLDLQDQFSGAAVEIDLLQTNKGISAAICSVGLDARVAYGIPKFRRLPFCGGSMAYNLSIAQQLCSRLGQKLHITIDDSALQEDCLMVALCNGATYGGGFVAAPEASLTDGLMDVMLIRKIGLLRIAKIIAIYKKGLHIKNGAVVPELHDVIRFVRAKKVTLAPVTPTEKMVVNMDGECSAEARLEVEVLEKAGRFFLPGKLAKERKMQEGNAAML